MQRPIPVPDDRFYSLEHEWLKIDGSMALMGISDHAQCSLGDVVYIELPALGQQVIQGAPIGVVESVKAVSDIFAPMSGVIREINNNIIEHPELINQDPYGQGWLVKIELGNKNEENKLLNARAYEELLEKEAK